ncbi:MAG TPA: Pr6Pr family membrane protein [Rudaea sp.]|jgi:hypothetical protein|nr:Pr6Pr family membrane protein [Rudaea sp.]
MKRRFATVVAAVAWLALILQLVVSINLGIARGFGWTYGVWMYVAFFTVLTNLLVALTLTIPLLAPSSRLGRFLANPASITGATANIILVCITYNVLLRHIWSPRGWQLIADLLLHDAVPILTVLFWWIAVPRASARWKDAAVWAIYPIVYFLYAMARGLASGFYPYPFIDVTRIGFGMVMLNAIGVLLAFFAILAALLALKSSFRGAESPKTAG